MSPNVMLRAVEEEDLDAIVSYLQHPECWGRRGIDDDRPQSMSRVGIRKAIQAWTDPEHGTVMVVDGETGPVGHVRVATGWDAVSPELDVVIAPDARRLGYGRAVARMTLDRLFGETVAHVVVAWVDDWNLAGLHFARSLGFREAGRLRRTGVRDRRYHSTAGFDLLRREWEARDADRR